MNGLVYRNENLHTHKYNHIGCIWNMNVDEFVAIPELFILSLFLISFPILKKNWGFWLKLKILNIFIFSSSTKTPDSSNSEVFKNDQKKSRYRVFSTLGVDHRPPKSCHAMVTFFKPSL